jgi:hypothetical protein
MKDEHFNAKKMKVLADCTSNYRKQNLQIQKKARYVKRLLEPKPTMSIWR